MIKMEKYLVIIWIFNQNSYILILGGYQYNYFENLPYLLMLSICLIVVCSPSTGNCRLKTTVFSWNSVPINHESLIPLPIPPPGPLAFTNVLSDSMTLTILGILYKWNHTSVPTDCTLFFTNYQRNADQNYKWNEMQMKMYNVFFLVPVIFFLIHTTLFCSLSCYHICGEVRFAHI